MRGDEMVVVIVIRKEYPKIQDAITELNQAEALGFEIQSIEVSGV